MMISKISYNNDLYVVGEPIALSDTVQGNIYVPIDDVEVWKELNQGKNIEGYNYNVKRVTQDVFLPDSVTFTSANIGEYNVMDGQTCDFEFTKKCHNAYNVNSKYINFMTFPFDYTVNEMKEALEGHEIELKRFKGIETFEIYENGTVHEINVNLGESLNDNEIIKAGHPIILLIDKDESTHTLSNYTFRFKNKKIVLNDIVSEHIQHDWYFVGNIAKNKANCTGLATATNTLIIGSNGYQFGTATANLGACGGFLEYRGEKPMKYPNEE
jgi:hypothetical protein